jgi:hypothetical protein
MGIKFTTSVVCGEVDVHLVNMGDNLYVLTRIEDLNACKGARRN